MGVGRSSRPLGHVRRVLAVAIVGGLLAAACGSGSDDDSGAQGSTGEATDGSALDNVLSGDGATTIPGDPGAPQATVPGGAPAPGTPSGGPSGGSSGSQTGSAGTATTVAAPAAGPMGRGVTAQTIALGAWVNDPENGNVALSALGVEGANFPDEAGIAKAVVDSINKDGGIGGRQIKLVVRKAPGQGPAEFEEGCRFFTEQNKVFAVAHTLVVTNPDVIATCLKRGETVNVVSGSRGLLDRTTAGPLAPYFYAPGNFAGERWGGIIDAIAATSDFFKKTATYKLGVIAMDQPAARRVVKNVVLPALQKHGISSAEQSFIVDTQDGWAQGFSSTAVRFRAAQVTHVLFVSTFSRSFFWVPAAESQRYYPRLAMTSGEHPALQESTYGGSQALNNTVGVGWSPPVDVGQPRDVPTPGSKKCLDIVRGAGVRLGDRWQIATAYSICDDFFFLKTALERGQPPTVTGLRAGVDGLGGSFSATWSLGDAYKPGQWDGLRVVRPFAYAASCGCFSYTGPGRELP